MLCKFFEFCLTAILYVIYICSIPIQLSFQPDSLQHLTSTGLYLSEQFSDEESWSEDDTPTPKTMQQWSDATLTGRSSFCSWGEDEGVNNNKYSVK